MKKIVKKPKVLLLGPPRGRDWHECSFEIKMTDRSHLPHRDQYHMNYLESIGEIDFDKIGNQDVIIVHHGFVHTKKFATGGTLMDMFANKNGVKFWIPIYDKKAVEYFKEISN